MTNEDQFRRDLLTALVDLQSRQTQLAIEQARLARALCGGRNAERKGPPTDGGVPMRLVKRASAA